MRHLRSSSTAAAAVEHLAAVAAAAAMPPPASSSSVGVHTDTFLILAAVLCFLFCIVGLAFVARCWRLCNPSAYSVDAEPEPPAMQPCKGLKRKALEALPTVTFQAAEEGPDEERAECAICLAEFARGDAVRVLPPCGHRFHAACVDVWLLSSSTCPSCRRALVVALPPAAAPRTSMPAAAADNPPRTTCCTAAQASAGAGERGPCRTSMS